MHRTDAQASRGTHTPIAADLAVDGIDEVFDVLFTVREHPGSRHRAGPSPSAAPTAERAWRITLGPDRIGVERTRVRMRPSSTTSNLGVIATASDLELTLYHRPALSPVDMDGDYTVLDEWHRDFTF